MLKVQWKDKVNNEDITFHNLGINGATTLGLNLLLRMT